MESDGEVEEEQHTEQQQLELQMRLNIEQQSQLQLQDQPQQGQQEQQQQYSQFIRLMCADHFTSYPQLMKRGQGGRTQRKYFQVRSLEE